MALHAQRFARYATLRADGLPALGTAAEGDYALTLRKDRRPDQATADRLAKALKVCQLLTDLCGAPITGPRRHPAWRILDSVVNHCLSYDVSVNDPDAMASHGAASDEAVLDSAAKIL